MWILIAGGIFIYLLLLSLQGPDTHEVWLSARDGNQVGTGRIAGNGKRNNPFHGDLDAIIDSLPAHRVIHLYPGVFFTQRYSENTTNIMGIFLKEGDVLKGAGVFNTFIVSPTNCGAVLTNGQLDMICNGFHGTNDHVTIEDLTVDAGFYSPGCKVLGIHLSGSYNTVENVRCVNWFGNAARKDESWGFFLHGGSPAAGVISPCIGNRIINCLSIANSAPDAVTNCYDDAFSCWGDDALIENCRSVYPIVTNVPFNMMCGINVAYMNNSVVAHNYLFGGTQAIYDDWGVVTNDIFDGNIIRFPFFGFFFNGQGATGNGVQIINNIIEGNPSADSSGWRGGIWLYNNATNSNRWRGLTISGNTIDTKFHGIVLMQPRNRHNFIGTKILGNTISRNAVNMVPQNGTFVENNIDQNGQPYDSQGLTNASFLPATVRTSLF